MSYRRYARELKDQACALVIEEKYDPADAGRQLGIPEMTLRGWLSKRNWKGRQPMSDARSVPQSDDPKVLNARIRELEAKLRRAEMERVLAETRKRYPLKGTPEERARLADHSYLYGPDGLPK